MLNQFNVSLWGDESFSAILSMKSISEIVSIISRDTSPPLYNLLEHFWFLIFGTSEVAIRSLSFLFFIIAVFFVYKIGDALWNKNTGFIATVLVFLNPFLFTYAFEGRMYSLLLMTVVGSFYFFITKKWLFYVLFTTASLYTHHFAIFGLFVQGLWFIKKYLFDHDKTVMKNLYAFIAIGILYIPWIIPLYNQVKMVGSGFWLGTPNLTDLRNLIYKFLAEGLNHPFSQLALLTVLAILILRVWQKEFSKAILPFLWFLVPIITVFILSQKFQSIFFDRYLLFAIPGAALLIASNPRNISRILIGVLISLFAIIDLSYFTNPTKLPFKDLANYVLETKKGDDYLINWNGKAHHLWESKYYQIPAPIYLPENKELPFFVGTALMTKEDIISTFPKKINRLGVITSDSLDEIKIPGYTKKEVKTFGNLRFIWYYK